MQRALVVGNWKLNGLSASNRELVAQLCQSMQGVADVAVAVCPPYPYLSAVGAQVSGSNIALGAQHVADQVSGAYTGEVSVAMLQDVGCKYVIIGHSERRALYGETDAAVAVKAELAIDAGLTPIVCVGETLEQREAGQTLAVIEQQVKAVLQYLPALKLGKLVIAYEPVWAIGTGKTASPAQAQEVHAFIRSLLTECQAEVAQQVPLLYGGSVKADNAAELFAETDIDGALVGGASLVAEQFSAIVKAASC